MLHQDYRKFLTGRRVAIIIANVDLIASSIWSNIAEIDQLQYLQYIPPLAETTAADGLWGLNSFAIAEKSSSEWSCFSSVIHKTQIMPLTLPREIDHRGNAFWLVASVRCAGLAEVELNGKKHALFKEDAELVFPLTRDDWLKSPEIKYTPRIPNSDLKIKRLCLYPSRNFLSP